MWRKIPEYSWEKSWLDEPHYGMMILATAVASLFIFSLMFGVIK